MENWEIKFGFASLVIAAVIVVVFALTQLAKFDLT